MPAKKEVEAVLPEEKEVEAVLPEEKEVEAVLPENKEETVPERCEEPLVLRAVSHILYQSRQYAPGQELPTNNLDMVRAWVDAGTAAWMSESSETVVKAVSVTAAPGLTGEAIGPETGSEADLVGKVPDMEQRKEE